jgi:signal transduction histidine kinase/ligand-binding sensor domain-containing protein
MQIFISGLLGFAGTSCWPSSRAAVGPRHANYESIFKADHCHVFFRTFFIFSCLLVLAQPLFAAGTPDLQLSQQYLVQVWQTDDGLPENWVSCITQTHDGYLWIGTRYGGLARFDGMRFVSFNPENTPELKDVQVEYAHVDETGTLWVMMGNESVTAFKNGRFYLFREPRAPPRLRVQSVLNVNSNSVLFVEEGLRLARLNLQGDTNAWKLLSPNPPASGVDQVFWKNRAGTIWYITQAGGLGRFFNEKFSDYPTGTNLPKSRITALTLDSQDRLWMTTTNQIFSWDGNGFEEQTPTNGPPAANIQHMVSSPDGGIWVCDGNHVRKCFGRAWMADAVLPNSIQRDNNGHLPQLYSDAEGNAWLIDYGHGLWCVRSNGMAYELTESDGLPNAFITCWFQDKEDNIWAGTVGGGVARISKRVVHVLGQDEKLPGKIARSVCLDQQGTLWAGTMSGGLAYWKDNHFVRQSLPSYSPTTPLESITVCPGYDGSLWVGTLRHGLMQVQSGVVIRPISPNDLPSVRILFEDSKRRLWVGGLADLRCYENGQFKQIGTDEGFQSSIAVGAMAEDAHGVIWIGTGPGDLWKFQDSKFTRFPPPHGWPSFRFAALQPDADGSIWIGTLGGGLLRFKDGHFFQFTSQQDLPNMYISQLLADEQGNLWAGTYAGIVRISKTNLNTVADGKESQLICRVYGRSSGLVALECSSGFQPSCWASYEGRLWFSTADGLAFIDPKDKGIAANQMPPPVIIEEISVDGVQRATPLTGDFFSSSSKGQPELQIEPGQHFVQFRFTGLSFAAPDEVSFRVKLEGAESKWRDLGYQRTVGYGPLVPGHYRLSVLACNSQGVWNKQGASLAFNVLPFFWQTWWFKVGLAVTSLLLTGLVVILILTRKHRLEMQKLNSQRELDRERARIAQDLHDDLGTSLTQISLLSSLADRETVKDEITSLNQQIRTRARAMVAGLDEIVWAVNPRNDSLVELINYLGNFAGEFFRAGQIRCRLDIPDRLPVRSLSSETRHHLYLAFKESINNVARHSGASRVWVSIGTEHDEIVISVKDNGQGFDASAKNFKSGDGLANTRARMGKIGGRADIQSAPGKGTAVVIRLPIK